MIVRRVDLLESEASPMIINRAYEGMQEANKSLTKLHKRYFDLIRKTKIESTGEKLWSIEVR